MSLMLGDMAVTTVVKHLNDSQLLHNEGYCGMRERFEGLAYKYERPKTTVGEYIVVNHLPFVHRSVVEEGIVNINIHVPQLKNGLPDIRRLAELTTAVASLFPEDTYLGKAFYEFYSDSRPTPDDDKTYYVNIQLNVTFNNLNK